MVLCSRPEILVQSISRFVFRGVVNGKKVLRVLQVPFSFEAMPYGRINAPLPFRRMMN